LVVRTGRRWKEMCAYRWYRRPSRGGSRAEVSEGICQRLILGDINELIATRENSGSGPLETRKKKRVKPQILKNERAIVECRKTRGEKESSNKEEVTGGA